MNPRILAACLLFLVLGLAQACGTGATRCDVASDCQGNGVCQGGFCTDLGLLGGGHPDANMPDVDEDGGSGEDGGVGDAGQEPDAGELNNGRG